MSQSKRQANQYDKIIKENLEMTLPVIVREVLGLNIIQSEELPDDIQHTKERKPDALKRVTDSKGNTYVLHIEFQVKSERDIVFRMIEYYAMLMRKYRIPVRQYVIYLGDKRPKMPIVLETERLTFSYDLIPLYNASYKLFLKSDNPEVKMLGILGNFEHNDGYTVIKEIIEDIKFKTEGEFAESRYFKQLRIFVQLRSNIATQFEKAMEAVSKFFKEERDFLYRRGEARGKAEGEVKKSYDVVENLIVDFGFTDEQAAKAAEVSIDFVQKVRADLAKKKQ
ncbi:MAG: hypothetical protein M5Z89_23820 [Olivibacter sp.]|nr:hypothetical protein [Olivibacter sp. UJ_SKK_5.1]